MMRKGDWFQTFTGKQWWPLDPRPEDVDIEDIAQGLAFQSRFNGHTFGFYSIAQHSVLVAGGVEREEPAHALVALLHDAAEAYLGDIVRPVKVGLSGFAALERTNLRVIMEALGVSNMMYEAAAPMVKHYDDRLLVTERRDLLRGTDHRWVESLEALEPMPGQIHLRTAHEAREMFLHCFHRLKAGRLMCTDH